MDGTVATLIAAISAFIAAVAAFSARRDAAGIKASVKRRDEGRALIGRAMDSGNEILQALDRHIRTVPRDREVEAALKVRVSDWTGAARAAVEGADQAQLARYEAQLGSHEVSAVVKELLRRLQDIQDRL